MLESLNIDNFLSDNDEINNNISEEMKISKNKIKTKKYFKKIILFLILVIILLIVIFFLGIKYFINQINDLKSQEIHNISIKSNNKINNNTNNNNKTIIQEKNENQNSQTEIKLEDIYINNNNKNNNNNITEDKTFIQELIDINRKKLEIKDNKGLIYYKVHMQGNGWIEWAKDGDIGGIINYNKRLECLNIFLNIDDLFWINQLKYRVETEHYGWTKWSKNGEKCGTTGEWEPIFNLQIILPEKNKKNIKYSVYSNNKWSKFVGSGELPLDEDNTIKIEAIKIKIE